MLHHQKATDGNEKLARGMGRTLPEPADDGGLALRHAAQPGARDRSSAIEHFRSQRRTAWARSSGSSTTAGR